MPGKLEAKVQEGGKLWLRPFECDEERVANASSFHRIQSFSRPKTACFFGEGALDPDEYSGYALNPHQSTTIRNITCTGLRSSTLLILLVVLDEATAAVDIETDALLQATLRSDMFKQRTIITIAHRINTILDSDRIVVLDHGSVAEFDSPSALVRRKGLFYELVKEANLLESVDLLGD